MASERCELVKEGFLDVKFPPDSPERVLHKAWRKLWIRTLILHPTKREPSLILHISRVPQDQQSHQSLKISRDGLRLFRCRSRSRPLQTWALSSGTSLIVYLAAENEEETQSWMHIIRNGLWPSIQNMTGKYYEVSLIDDEKTFSTGILGLYGRLVKASDGMISIIHPHWQGVQLRWKQEDVINIQLVRKVGNEASESGVFKITLKSLKTDPRTFYFYSITATSAVEWLVSSLTDSKEFLMNKKEHLNQSEKVNDDITENNGAFVYATVSRVSKLLEKSNSIRSESIEKTKAFNGNLQSSQFLCSNISSELLDSSFNFSKLPQTKADANHSPTLSPKSGDDSGDDSSVSYEHFYEEMIPKSSRSPTVYETVQNFECEYVPPLPPPLPEKPKIHRLLKLSESVADALKLAEGSPVNNKNCKYLRDNPIKETQLSEKKPLLHRLSQPNLT